MFNPCAVSIVLCCVAACYVVTCQILQAPEHRYLAAELISHEEINHDNLVKGGQDDVSDNSKELITTRSVDYVQGAD